MKTRKIILIVYLVVLPLAIVCNFPPTANGADEKALWVRRARAAVQAFADMMPHPMEFIPR